MGPLFNPTLTPEVRAWQLGRFKSKLEYLNNHELADGRAYIVGTEFTVADAILFIVLSWLPYVGVEAGEYPVVKKYFEGIKALPFVQEAQAEVGALVAKAQ